MVNDDHKGFWLGGDYQISAEFLVYNNDVL